MNPNRRNGVQGPEGPRRLHPPCLADPTKGIEICDHIVFSANTCNIYNTIRSRHILLDTCAGESVFNDSSLQHNVEHALTPMIVSGVNPKGKPWGVGVRQRVL